ncbi:hypothetical protein AB1484_07175 [Parafrankia sp. FMc6]|uniref:hypothetical protein n=1 Tax=Parafrankia soli TaxID=2599596 RepID=UPI0034D600B5
MTRGTAPEPREPGQRRGRRLPRTPPAAGPVPPRSSVPPGTPVPPGDAARGGRAVPPRSPRPESPRAADQARRFDAGAAAAVDSPDGSLDGSAPPRRPMLRRAATPRAVPPPAPMGRKDPSFPPATSAAAAAAAAAAAGTSTTAAPGTPGGAGATGSPGSSAGSGGYAGSSTPGSAARPGSGGSGSGGPGSGASGSGSSSAGGSGAMRSGGARSGGTGRAAGSAGSAASRSQRPEASEAPVRRAGGSGGTSAPPPSRRPTSAGPRRPGRPSALAPRTPAASPPPAGPASGGSFGEPTPGMGPGPFDAPTGLHPADAFHAPDAFRSPETTGAPGAPDPRHPSDAQGPYDRSEPLAPGEAAGSPAPAWPSQGYGQADVPLVDPSPGGLPMELGGLPMESRSPSGDQPGSGSYYDPWAPHPAPDAGNDESTGAPVWGAVDAWQEAGEPVSLGEPAQPGEAAPPGDPTSGSGPAERTRRGAAAGETETETETEDSAAAGSPSTGGAPPADEAASTDAAWAGHGVAAPERTSDVLPRPSTELVPAGHLPRPGTGADRAPALTDQGPGQGLWPWQEPWADLDDLEPWEEIPLRITLSDRAAVALPGSWRIAVTSLFPYSGTTTLAGVVGLTLAGVRAEPVLAIDLYPGAATPGFVPPTSSESAEIDESRGDNLVARVGSRGTTTVADIARRRRSAAKATPDELRSLVGARRSGSVFDLDVLPVDRPVGDEETTNALVPVDEPITPAMLRSALGALGYAYPLILIDAPATAPLTPEAIRAADVILLVTLATASDLEATLADLRDPQGSLAEVGVSARERTPSGQGPGHPPHERTGPAVIAAVVSPRRGRPSPRTRTATARLARHVDGIVRVPYDPRLDPSRGTPVRIPRLRWATRRSYLRLAAETVDALAGIADADVGTPAGGEHPPFQPQFERPIRTAPVLPRNADTDHAEASGVSFGDLRHGSTPTRVSGPDRPGGQPPAGREPR